MNIQNLTQEEIKNLHTLLGKILEEPTDNKDSVDPIDELIDEIMDTFDFSSVFETMELLDWRWVTAKHGIPNVDELKATAERLLRDAAKARLGSHKDAYWHTPIHNSTGGFEATAYCNEKKTKIIALRLDFVVASWTGESADWSGKLERSAE